MMTARSGGTVFTGLTKQNVVQISIESIIAQISHLAKSIHRAQIPIVFDSVHVSTFG